MKKIKHLFKDENKSHDLSIVYGIPVERLRILDKQMRDNAMKAIESMQDVVQHITPDSTAEELHESIERIKQRLFDNFSSPENYTYAFFNDVEYNSDEELMFVTNQAHDYYAKAMQRMPRPVQQMLGEKIEEETTKFQTQNQ